MPPYGARAVDLRTDRAAWSVLGQDGHHGGLHEDADVTDDVLVAEALQGMDLRLDLLQVLVLVATIDADALGDHVVRQRQPILLSHTRDAHPELPLHSRATPLRRGRGAAPFHPARPVLDSPHPPSPASPASAVPFHPADPPAS